METAQYLRELGIIVDNYTISTIKELNQRWKKWKIDLDKVEIHEVIGALMARQVTLAVELANAPIIWNGHIAPLILRSMIDTYINMAWILENPHERATKFIEHGLGQEKLILEHLKAATFDEEVKDQNDLVAAMENWLNSQKLTYFIEVNLGSWSGQSTRKMAEEAQCIDIYNYAYLPFSSATHSMWNHISKYNLKICQNPLHRYHKIPDVPSFPVDIDYLYRAAKYVKKTFDLFDTKTEIKIRSSSFTRLVKALNKLMQSRL